MSGLTVKIKFNLDRGTALIKESTYTEQYSTVLVTEQ